MIKAILFDLDGTLLPLDMDDFLRKYLHLLSQKLSSYLEPKIFISELMAATSAMIENQDYSKCNAQVFTEAFFTATGLLEHELMPVFEHFYQNEYRTLGKKFKANPIVNEIVELAKSKGYQLVLATNPLFPLIAIKERIKWAGINPEMFTLITSYEDMHAAKPNPQYFTEIADKISVAPKHCLMVGNDVEEDLASKTAGMQTFLVEDCLLNRNNLPITTDYHGDLNSLLDFIMDLKCIF